MEDANAKYTKETTTSSPILEELKETPQKKTSHKTNDFNYYDSLPKLEVDDYPISNKMLTEAKYLDTPILHFDGVWFTYKNQVLAFALYTDNFRYAIFHFEKDNIPDAMLKKIELMTPEGKPADFALKRKIFSKLFQTINPLPHNFFRTNKGFVLGDNKINAISIYGRPHTSLIENGIEILSWEFTGDIFYDGKTDLKGTPLAKNSFGHQVTMYFEKQKLIGLFLHNNIP